MSTAYVARLHRIGRWWAVDVPDLDIHTQCRTLDEAEDMARDAIAQAIGIPPDTITVDLVVPEFASLLQCVLEAKRHRAAADAAEQQAIADAARTLVEELRVSQGDACRLLGLSHQDVSHLSPARASTDARPWQLGPPSTPSTPDLTPGSGIRGDMSQLSKGRQPQRQRPALTSGSPRQASFSRPGWAIAEDDV
ncbi:type II toxin-antitoxin system HicB family antitoxin [Streptomyces sp. ISL-100]|uniref:type II toxin-antitoxin system HicB family antitoxin n=1 Tax=Streptomyces sp. ISL-100 TaxID=2819173 RepID=UPI001BECE9D8|nr:hypothetical protein [Streptomyces sp. ISL-100]MBT2395969.1 hypothetical protein [Streptomyces sp. ISL-100]